MSQTSSYDVVVGAVATVMRVTMVPTEGATPGYYLFAGYLETAEGVGIGGKMIALFINDEPEYSFMTSATGFWNFDGFYLAPGATYQVYAIFGGDATYDASATTTYPLTPSLIPTVMEVTTAPPTPVDAGVSFNFDGHLREEGLAGIVGRTIELYINGVASGTTDTTVADGYWLFPISFTEAGTYLVQAVFPGDATYSGCHKELSTRGPLLAVAGVLAGLVGIACLRH